MKTRNTILWHVVVALALLLGAGAAQAQAQVVFGDPNDLTKATGILNLEVPGHGIFDVSFDYTSALDLYGGFPGDFTPLPPFFTVPETEIAATAVNVALNAGGAFSIGTVGGPRAEAYNIGDLAFLCCLDDFFIVPSDLQTIAVIRSVTEGTLDWIHIGENFLSWSASEKPWALFGGSGTVCGNGEVEGSEECDDGNTDSGDGCSSICTNEVEPMCGNGITEGSEECDDGNTDSGDGCSDICLEETPDPVCGNSIPEAPEECDDGNTASGDGCSATCMIEAGQDTMVLFEDESEPTKATGIANLEVPGFGTFDVAFDQNADADDIYGDFPGDEVPLEPFFDVSGVSTAANAVSLALMAGPTVFEIGEVGVPGTNVYNIGVASFLCCFEEGELDLLPNDLQSISVGRAFGENGDWGPAEENATTWVDNVGNNWAVFTAPEPSTSLLSVAALATLGVVRRWRRKGSQGTA
jgi:cysteine-rich repeat protein